MADIDALVMKLLDEPPTMELLALEPAITKLALTELLAHDPVLVRMLADFVREPDDDRLAARLTERLTETVDERLSAPRIRIGDPDDLTIGALRRRWPRDRAAGRSGAPIIADWRTTASNDEHSGIGPLTSDDWVSARKALGKGSRSLLFGTSRRALDAAKERAMTQWSVPPSTLDRDDAVADEAEDDPGFFRRQ